MRADGDGGAVEILGRSGAIMMKFSEYGGRIVAGGRKNSGLAQLGVGKRGGWVSVSGAGDSEGKRVCQSMKMAGVLRFMAMMENRG